MTLDWLRWIGIGLVLAILAMAGFGYREYRASSDRAELEQARSDLNSKKYALARERLAKLVSGTSNGEVLLELGRAEQALGNVQAAMAAWSEVSADSPFASRASVLQARLLVDSGRFTAAENLLEPLIAGDGPPDREVRQTLELLYRIEGRNDRVRRLLIDSWSGSDEPASVLQRLERLDRTAYPIGIVREVVSVGDPADDRVWLAQANLARSSGQFDRARKLLDRCRKSRPNDSAVWLSLLHLAMAMDEHKEALEATSHLPSALFTEAERIRIQCWFLARGDDRSLECKVLRTLVAIEPGDIAAWDRLAELATLRGDLADAQACRLRRAEANDLRERYKALIERYDRQKSAHELARLAASLGRATEAKGWSLIDQGVGSSQPLQPMKSIDPAGPSLQSCLHELPRNTPSRYRSDEPTTPVSVAFTDEAAPSGLKFLYNNGHRSGHQPPPPEAMGGGVALLDFDGDGFLDVYLVQGGSFPFLETSADDGDRLFRNMRDGRFEDVTERSGISQFPKGYGHGVTVGDIDKDGHPDLFVTRWRSYAFYRNRGDGTFEDLTEPAGLGGDRDWPTSAVFADLDNDGDLDLYVCHYLAYDEHNPRRCVHPEAPTRRDCSPIDFAPLPDHAFRNDNGHFVDVTESAGLLERTGRGLGVVAADLDADGLVDLYVANDMSANFLYKNVGSFRFEEVAARSGAAASADGGYKAGMGVACGDINGDGLPDIGVTNYFGEATTYYQNLGRGVFADHTEAVGLGSATRIVLGFGIVLFDANNDGRLDVLTANGHVIDSRPQFPWTMPLQILEQRSDGRLIDVSSRAGDLFRADHLGRGLAIGDLDNDGRVDAIAVCQNEPVVLLRNRTEAGGHQVTFQLAGKTSNRDGIGATVTVYSGDLRWTAPRIGGGSYQSSSDHRLHFGVGSTSRIDRVEVRWPSGTTDLFTNLGVDTAYLLQEGAKQAQPLQGWQRASETGPQ